MGREGEGGKAIAVLRAGRGLTSDQGGKKVKKNVRSSTSYQR